MIAITRTISQPIGATAGDHYWRVAYFVFLVRIWWADSLIGRQNGFVGDDAAASLQKRLKFIALDKVPTPGLEVKGWEIKPRTPVSSFKDGVQIRNYANGIATISVKTSCFCLSGAVRQDLLGPQPADAGLPEGTYFQLRQAIPLEIVFEAPLSFAP